MPNRAAIITGASSGIGLAIAKMLGEEGHALTLAARRPEKLTAAADELRGAGFDVQEVAGNMADEDTIKARRRRPPRPLRPPRRARQQRRRRRRRRRPASTRPSGSTSSSSVNLRAIVLFYREAMELLRAAGAEHRNALVVNTSSISGKSGQPWLSVYSATKAGVVGYTQAMNKELNGDGIKSVALCPGFVETPMTEFVREHVPAEDMIRVEDVAEAVRFVLRTSPNCVIPEIVFQRPGEAL